MRPEDVKKIVLEDINYNFIWDGTYKPLLIVMSGSHAYGTQTDTSDIDVRGIVMPPKEALIGLSPFEQHEVHNKETDVDAVLYGLPKATKLILDNNPNMIELLSPQERNHIYVSPAGQKLIELRHDFLSQRAVFTFGAYAKAQLARIENAMTRDRYNQAMAEEHLKNSIVGMINSMNGRYKALPEGSLILRIVDSEKDDLDKEIVVDCHLDGYPLRDFKSIWSDMQNVVKDYSKLTGRNNKKDDAHMNKHSCHLVRLLLMAIDLCEKEEIITYRENDLDLLMSIRNGDYMKDGIFIPEFYKLVHNLEDRLEKAAANTKLPKKPNFHKIEKAVMEINEEYLQE